MYPVIRSFKNYLYQVGYTETVQQMLPACVGEFLEQQQITDISCVDQQQVRSFYAWLQERPLKKRVGMLSDMMIHQYVYALRTFFNWAEVTDQLDYNPVSGMRFKRPVKQTRHPLPVEAIKELFRVAVTLKEIALLHLFYSCGLRRSEGEALNSRDIHFREQLLYVRAGKGARRRVIPLTEKVASDLEQYYLQDRCGSVTRKVKDEDAFLLNRLGGRLRGDGYLRLLRALTQRAGISGEITLHHLRHSIATHLLASGMSMEYVRDFLGHRYLESTQVYAKPLPEQLKLL